MYDPDSVESFERVLLWRRIRVIAKKFSLAIALLAMATGTFLVINYGPSIWSKRGGERVLVSTPAKTIVSYRQAGRWRIRETYRAVGRWTVYTAEGS